VIVCFFSDIEPPGNLSQEDDVLVPPDCPEKFSPIKSPCALEESFTEVEITPGLMSKVRVKVCIFMYLSISGNMCFKKLFAQYIGGVKFFY